MIFHKSFTAIFKNSSKTYFYSSLFFPREVYKKVSILYAFVRLADNFADQVSQDRKGFEEFWEKFWQEWHHSSGDRNIMRDMEEEDHVLEAFALLAHEKNFEMSWIRAFENSMRQDFTKHTYATIAETLDYIHGSAEVIGLMMCRLMDVEEKAYPNAISLGRAMQYANFIRDIAEDVTLGRNYFPQDEMTKHGLANLEFETVASKKKEFELFISSQIQHYDSWQAHAEEGYHYLPSWGKRAVKTSASMYKWTMHEIKQNPMIVYEKKVKPSTLRILWQGVTNG